MPAACQRYVNPQQQWTVVVRDATRTAHRKVKPAKTARDQGDLFRQSEVVARATTLNQPTITSQPAEIHLAQRYDKRIVQTI